MPEGVRGLATIIQISHANKY